MSQWLIRPGSIHGTLAIPSSKSHTLRALTFALMAKGVSHIRGYLHSPDTRAMIQALRHLGAVVDVFPDHLAVDGTGGKLQPAEDVIDCGNSGQVLRFIGALAALLPSYTILTGDPSIRHNRPVRPLLDGLSQLGAFAVSARGDGFAPIILRGPLTRAEARLPGADSQPVSGLIIAGCFAPHPTVIRVEDPGETPWIELTLRWLEKFKLPYANERFERYALQGGARINAFDYTVPGDFSSAAFPIAAALLTDSELTIHPIDMDDPQGDKAIIPILQKMGAHFHIDHAKKTLTVKKGSSLRGMKIDCNAFIDALPILAVIGCFAEGTTVLCNAEIARKKESDRIRCIATELKKMGADIEEKSDGLVIHKSDLKGTTLESHHDHRIALSLAVAAFAASGQTAIHGTEAAKKTYPNFVPDFAALGAHILETP